MPKKILIVEDEALIALGLKLDLEESGYTVLDPVDSGKEAIRIADEKRPDAVILDISLRGSMDGIEAAENISAIYECKIVFTTGYLNVEANDRAKRVKHSAVLRKPPLIDEIVQAIGLP